MAKLGYDQYQSLRFRTDHSLWGDAGLAFRLQFFHVGRGFSQPVHLFEVVEGQSREIVYDPSMFEFDKSGIDPGLMRDHAGFAGFRVQFVTDWKADVAAFLGASYFRAVGGIRANTVCRRAPWPSIPPSRGPRNFPTSRPFGSNGRPRVREP